MPDKVEGKENTQRHRDKFLQAVAEYYTRPEYGADLYRTCLVCPNKRSRIFLRMYLKERLREAARTGISPETVFMPEIITIGDLNERIIPDVVPAGDIDLLFRLYRIYCSVYTQRFAKLESVFAQARAQLEAASAEYTRARKAYHELLRDRVDREATSEARKIAANARRELKKCRRQCNAIPSAEPVGFDHFAYWGRTLLNDFNDIDNGCADGFGLFEKIAEWKSLSVNYLSEKEWQLVNELFPGNNIRPESSEVMFRNMDSFSAAVRRLRLYALLPEIYRRFTAEIDKEGVTYGGRLARKVAERMAVAARNSEPLPYLGRFRHIGFVGFGNLTAAQMNMLDTVRASMDTGCVRFFWDRLDTGRLGQSLAVNDYVARFADKEVAQQGHTVFPNPEDFTLPEYDGPLRIDIINVPSKFMMGKTIGRVIERWCTAAGRSRSADPLAVSGVDTRIDPEKSLMKVRNRPDNTAIILPDSSLLIPILHSMPATVVTHPYFENINVSLALPFRETPFASLLDAIIGLHLHAAYRRCDDGSTDIHNLREDIAALVSNPQLRNLMPEGCHAVSRFIDDNRSFSISLDALDDYLRKESLADPAVAAIRPFFATTPRMPERPSANGEATPEFIAYIAQIRLYITGIIKTLKDRLRNRLEQIRHTDGAGQLTLDFDDEISSRNYVSDDSNIESDILEAYEQGMHQVFDCIDRYNIAGIGERTILTMMYRIMAVQPLNMSSTPVRGLQILEMLETRAIDFDNLIIPSMNEGIMPAKSRSRSFISQGFRHKYNETATISSPAGKNGNALLPIVRISTSRDTEHEYAGYFFRLLNRAKNVVCLYDSRTSIPGGGTPSRYLQQLRNSHQAWSCNDETARLRPTANRVEIAAYNLAKDRHAGAPTSVIAEDLRILSEAEARHRLMVKVEESQRNRFSSGGRMLHPVQIADITMQMEPKSPRPRIFTVDKDEFVMRRLSRFTTSVEDEDEKLAPYGLRAANLSASALRNYIRCPFLFYLRFVLNIGEGREVNDFLDASEFGTVVHDTLQQIFEKTVGRGNQVSRLASLFEKDRWKLTNKARELISDTLRDNIVRVHYNVKPPRTVMQDPGSDASPDEKTAYAKWRQQAEKWERMRHNIRRQDEIVIGGMTDYVEMSLKKDFAETADGSRLYLEYLRHKGADATTIEKYAARAAAAQTRDIIFEGAEVDLNPTWRETGSHGTKCRQWRYDGPENRVNLTLKIDRIDRYDYTDSGDNTLRHLRFIDYKTGNDRKYVASIESLFPVSVLERLGVEVPERLDAHGTVFQLLLYAMLYTDLALGKYPRTLVETHLYTLLKSFVSDSSKGLSFADSDIVITESDKTAIKAEGDIRAIWQKGFEAEGDDSGSSTVYDTRNRNESVRDMEQRFRHYVGSLIKEIMDPAVPFGQTTDIDRCKYCDFAELCQRYKSDNGDTDGDTGNSLTSSD